MSTGDLLSIQPTELKFPFELKKQSSCSLQLTNKTDRYAAFKVKTTDPKKYCVRPNAGVVLPRSTCDVIVTMQAQKKAPLDMQCKDKFLLQSVVAPDSSTTEDITPEMFSKEDGKVVEEFKLRVIYFPANPPSSVPEGSDGGSSPRASVLDSWNQNSSLFDALTKSLEEPKEKSSEVKASKVLQEQREKSSQVSRIFEKLNETQSKVSKSTEEKGKKERSYEEPKAISPEDVIDEELMECFEILNNMEEIDGDSYSKALKLLHGDAIWRKLFVLMPDQRRKDFIRTL